MSSQKTIQWLHFLVLVVVALPTTGCGTKKGNTPTGKVEGVVTLGGKSLNNGGIAFYDPKTGTSAGGEIKDGKFKIDDPVKVGEYQVSIQPPAAPQPDSAADIKTLRSMNVIPAAYQDGSSSGLTAKVSEGPNSYTFKLSKKGPRRGPKNQTPP